MSLEIWAVWKLLLYLLIALPFLSIRNFSKFQAMSLLLTGFQMMNFGSPIRLSESSDGTGSSVFNHENTGCSPSPLIKILSNMMHFGWKPFPGRTYFKALMISCPLEFSWWPNWFVGKAKITNLSPYFSQSSFICVKSRTVVPHNDAVFSTRTTLFFSSENLNSVPSNVLAVRS